MPQIGLGTFATKEGNCVEIVKSAILDHGYRHIDTAKVYRNEEEIGQALQEVFAAGINREEIFVTTKLTAADKDDVERALREGLKKLQIDYVDLYLVHWIWPKVEESTEMIITNTPLHKVWEQMEKMVELGLTKSIGVSNCTIPMLIDLLSYAKIKPVMNQVEIHPYLTQTDFLNFHKKLNIAVTAYSPLGASSWGYKEESHKSLNLFEEKIIVDIAEKHGKKPSQILLNWGLQRGYAIIPKTANKDRLSENLNVYDFKLSEEEISQISSLNRNARFYNPKMWGGVAFFNAPYFE